jgi:hypothetical protein
MELQYKGSTIVTVVTNTGGAFSASLEIIDAHGERRDFADIGRFASPNAASNFAVTWAMALLDEKALPQPPFKTAHAINS